MSKAAVRFIKPAPPYITGDVAVFPRERAQSLVDRHIAEPFVDEAAAVTDGSPPKKAGKAAGTDPAA